MRWPAPKAGHEEHRLHAQAGKEVRLRQRCHRIELSRSHQIRIGKCLAGRRLHRLPDLGATDSTPISSARIQSRISRELLDQIAIAGVREPLRRVRHDDDGVSDQVPRVPGAVW